MIPSGFFPDNVTYHFSSQQMGPEALSENELAVAQKYGAKRFADFCTGRYCLRKSIAPYNFTGDILIGDRGMPLLPDHITASLSHSKKLCGAVASLKQNNISLGIDIETNGRVHEEMWRLLFTPKETTYLSAQNKVNSDLLSTVFFSMKEAYYKMQFPLTGVYLDFPEVEIEHTDGFFVVTLLKDVNDRFPKHKQTSGHMLQLGNEIITYCALTP